MAPPNRSVNADAQVRPRATRAIVKRPFLIAVVITLSAASVGAETLTCPSPERVTLSAEAADWQSYPRPQAFDSPKLVLDNMRLTPNHVWCQYGVGGGTVRMRLIRQCVAASGKWDEQGQLFKVCSGPNPAACSVECEK
jgi:hypothetical protein